MERLQRELSAAANDKQTIMCEELPGGLARYELFREKNKGGEYIYGIVIESDLPYDRGSVSVSDITEDEALAKELFERVIAYVVTPGELVYAAEDFIWEKYGA